MGLDSGFGSFPAGSGDDFSRRIRICGPKCWISASRGLNIIFNYLIQHICYAHIEVVVNFAVSVCPLQILVPRTNLDDLWKKFSYRRPAASVSLPASKSFSRVFFKAFKF